MTKVNRKLPGNIPVEGVSKITDQLNAVYGIKCTPNENNTELEIEIESSNPNDILSLGVMLGMLEFQNQK